MGNLLNFTLQCSRLFFSLLQSLPLRPGRDPTTTESSLRLMALTTSTTVIRDPTTVTANVPFPEREAMAAPLMVDTKDIDPMPVAVTVSSLSVVSRASVVLVVSTATAVLPATVAAESDLEVAELLLEPDSAELKVELSVAPRDSSSGTSLILTTPTDRSATRARATTSGLTTHGTSGEPTTIGTPRNPLITSGATTLARSTSPSTPSLATTTTTSDSSREASVTRVTRTPPVISATLKVLAVTPSDTPQALTLMVTPTREIMDMAAGPTTLVPGTTELTTTTMADNSSMTSVMLPTMPTIPLISSKPAELLVATVTSTLLEETPSVVSSTEVAELLTVMVMLNSAQSPVSADATPVVLFPTESALAEPSLALPMVAATRVSLPTTLAIAALTTARREPPSNTTKNNRSTTDGECFDKRREVS